MLHGELVSLWIDLRHLANDEMHAIVQQRFLWALEMAVWHWLIAEWDIEPGRHVDMRAVAIYQRDLSFFV